MENNTALKEFRMETGEGEKVGTGSKTQTISSDDEQRALYRAATSRENFELLNNKEFIQRVKYIARVANLPEVLEEEIFVSSCALDRFTRPVGPDPGKVAGVVSSRPRNDSNQKVATRGAQMKEDAKAYAPVASAKQRVHVTKISTLEEDERCLRECVKNLRSGIGYFGWRHDGNQWIPCRKKQHTVSRTKGDGTILILIRDPPLQTPFAYWYFWEHLYNKQEEVRFYFRLLTMLCYMPLGS
jgi:hypothetical protein